MKSNHAIGLASLILASAAVYACGGGMPEAPSAPSVPAAPSAPAAPEVPAAPATSAAPAASAAPASSAAPAAEASAWDSLSHEQKLEIMKTKVLPQMKAAFQAQDPKHFANFSCKTCHGDGIKQNKFDMPNPALPKMDFEKWKKTKPDMMKFMGEKVVPTMASILGEKPFDMQTHTGFGCGECHTKP